MSLTHAQYLFWDSPSQVSPGFAKPRSPRKVRKASASEGFEGTTYTALKPRFANVSQTAHVTF
jgi:hypothetical protein